MCTDELKKGEERRRVLIDNAHDLLFRTDIDGRILFVSESVRKLTGYSVEEALGMKMPEELYANTEKYDGLLAALRKNDYIDDFEVRLKRKDGSTLWASINARLCKFRDGSIIDVEGVARDVTERKAWRAHFQRAREMGSANALAGGLAHDLNNILFPIMGCGEILLEDIPGDSPLNAPIKEILSGIGRVEELVKKILSFGRQTVEGIKPLEIQNILEEVLQLSRSVLPPTITIERSISNDCGMVRADPTRIRQAAMNLIANALDAMEDSNGVLTVALEEVELTPDNLPGPALSPGPYVRLTIGDTGAGMDAAAMKEIFTPDFTTEGEDKGSGLGLAAVHGIVRTCKGEIVVRSEPGKGSDFIVYLPRITSRGGFGAGKNPVAAPTGNERVLHVDDDEAISRMVRQVLERLGYRVATYNSGEDALAALLMAPRNFDLVLTDMTMPDMTGDGLTIEIRKIRRDIPVILCTGLSEEIVSGKAAEVEFDRVLMKPMSTADLAGAVREVLDGNRKLESRSDIPRDPPAAFIENRQGGAIPNVSWLHREMPFIEPPPPGRQPLKSETL